MSRLLSCSHGVVLATAMAVSAGTLILFDLLREKYQDPKNQDSIHGNQILRPCLSSGSKKRGENKKKKKVHFGEDVKDSSGNGKEYRKEYKNRKGDSRRLIQSSSCGNEILEIPRMPPNRAALYSGILKDRLQRIGYSF